jgi:Ca2+-binding RTX toxin-like protein
VGGGGPDRIYGGDGGAAIFGDHSKDAGNDYETTGCGGGATVASDPVNPPVPVADDAADLILGGNGVDVVNAGGGGDHVSGFGGADVLCGNTGNDTIDAGTGADMVWGGAGLDTIFGGDGEDMLYGNDDADTVYGGDQPDTIEGNNGADTLFGGLGNDTVVGGTRFAGRADTGDTLYGDAGADVLIGDNGVADGAGGGTPYDLDGATPSAGGADVVFGGPGPDHGYGGLAGDTVYGGDDADYLEGNNGTDTVFGGSGDDDIIGGSSQVAVAGSPDTTGRPDNGDFLHGGTGTDVIAGDNAAITPAGAATANPVMLGRGLAESRLRAIAVYDTGGQPTAGTSGGDQITGDNDVDVIFGQGGSDTISGGLGDDYAEGGQAADTINGDAGQDDLVGGSWFVETGSGQLAAGQPDAGDTIAGGTDGDVILGDNGAVLRTGPTSVLTQQRGIVERSITPYDLAPVTAASTHGADLVTGDAGNDVILGQAGTDRLKGNADGDYVEGGADADWVEGNAGDDELVGGSSTVDGTDTGATAKGQPDTGDVVYGGSGDDLIVGDNAVTTRVGPADPRTFRVGPTGLVTQRRSLRLLDLQATAGDLLTPATGRSGNDQLSGGAGVDVLLGQDGNDAVTGGPQDDYAEGNGGADSIWGDQTLAAAGVTPPPVVWPGTASPTADLEGDLTLPDGQDDLLGGSPTAGFRDAGDRVEGDGGADYAIGDNGTVVRDILNAAGQVLPDASTGTGPVTNRVYTLRYASPPPAAAAYVRHGAPGQTSTRFCATRPQGTCEQPGAYGDDTILGDGGDDTLYGQDGNDTMNGGDADDDMYGELGNDTMSGDTGDDAMVGDRGGVVDRRENGSRTFTFTSNQVPQITFTGFVAGTVTRQTDLLHDVNGDAFAGSSTSAAMPYDGVSFGGNDRMRGGTGHDSMHGGTGDDLINGDSGGDIVFGDDGADVLWGGKGSDDPANPNDRGAGDSLVDYIFGGKGATSGPSVDPTTGVLGADVIDFRPRGSYPNDCASTPWPGPDLIGSTVDPCAWFQMTGLDDADPNNNQHHQGIDWIYGGWDRDVLQADVADNGPNQGDRLLDWTGAYNLYTHCPAAYGGYNDVRQFSPTMQTFLQKWAGAEGAGQGPGDVTTAGTGAFDDLALVYQSDITAHGSGPDFPNTAGHFVDIACSP